MRKPTPRTITSWLAVMMLLLPAAAMGQVDKEVQRAFAALRSDKVKHNCGEAISALFSRREELKDALVDELYRTDEQGRGALMFILYNTKSFTPDDRFLQLVMRILPADQKNVSRRCGCDLPITVRDDGHLDQIVGRWQYVDTHFEQFEPLLTPLISTTKDSWMLWAIAWMYKKHGIFESKADLFTREVLGVATANLANDNVSWNAAAAVRLFLIFGDKSVPLLQAATRSRDAQARYFAKATLDALKGEHRAFGYLGSKVDLSETVVGDKVIEPEWMGDLVADYMDKDTYP